MSELGELKSFIKQVHTALRAWREPGAPESLLSFLLLVQQRQPRPGQQDNATLQRLATNEVLLDGIDTLQTQDEQLAYVLRQRFPDNRSIIEVSNQLNVSEHTVSRYQRTAIERLAEIIFTKELALRDSRVHDLESYIPPSTYTQLFGVDETITAVTKKLLLPHSPWLVAVVGLGGIGKTAVADAITRYVIRQFCFDDVVWVGMTPLSMNGNEQTPKLAFHMLIASLAEHFFSANDIQTSPDGRLRQVRQYLKSRPVLVVVDNLEDEAEVAYLLTHLADLAEPSKFLLTSRVRPPTQATAWTHTVAELGFTEAKALMQRQAQDAGIEALDSAKSEDYEAIYAVTGGNPLALKLVVGLLDVLPLIQVLGGFEQGQKGEIGKMYTYIYWQTWNTLSENGRQLLQAMPIVSSSGGTQDYLRALSDLDEADLWPAVQELRGRSLLEVRGTINEKKYGIHRLTETFLHTEIVGWDEEEDPKGF